MALFPETVFPSYSYTITPKFRTLRIGLTDGDVIQRRRKRTTPLYRIVMRFNVLTESEEKTLFDFYMARSGGWQSFSMFDFKSRTWAGESVGTGDGSTTDFNAGAKTISSYTVYVDDVEQTEGAGDDYTVNATAGTDAQAQISFNAGSEPANGAVITIDYTGFKYFALCVFQDDEMDRDLFVFNLYKTGLIVTEVSA